MNASVVPNRVYMHRNGGRYRVQTVAFDATNERNGNEVVVYTSEEDGKIYCRDLVEFTELIEWPDGTRRSRFVPAE